MGAPERVIGLLFDANSVFIADLFESLVPLQNACLDAVPE